MLQILFCVLFAITPLHKSIYWLYKNAIHIQNQLETKKRLSHFTAAPFVELLILIINFIKGFSIPYIIHRADLSPLILLLSFILTFLFALWPPLNLFKREKKSNIVLWGLFTFMHPSLFIIYPLCFIAGTLLFNSFIIGQLLAILSLYYIIWSQSLNPYFLLANTLFFILSFLSVNKYLHKGLNNQQLNIKFNYKKR
eukprot:COSAG01_NODE_2_length_63927_cov_1357.611941_30_plen_197_part_00